MNKVEFLEKAVFFLDRKLIEWCVIFFNTRNINEQGAKAWKQKCAHEI